MSADELEQLEWDEECPRCGGRKWYDERHDAFFCHRDDVWLSQLCGDRKCSYCRARPARPSVVTS